MPGSSLFRCLRVLALALAAMATAPPAGAAIQFDCFPGFEGKLARSGAWYPVAFEIFNDGPSFQGVVEIRPDTFSGTLQQIPIELPSNTRKRLTVARFCGTASTFEITARLLDDGGKVRAEAPRSQVRTVYSEVPLLGALSGTFSSLPSLPELKRAASEHTPTVVRLDTAMFPDDPLQLEALNALYLNTARALELKEPQSEALLAWLHLGGHLIVAVDQPADLAALQWLRPFLPGAPQGDTNASVGPAVRAWAAAGPDLPPWGNWGGRPDSDDLSASSGGLRSRRSLASESGNVYSDVPADPKVTGAPLPLTLLRAGDGRPLDGGMRPPWALSAPRGRGRITLLAFNPEREPFRSSGIRPWFWARLTGLSTDALKEDRSVQLGESLEPALASMVETKQIRKLPLGVLLLLLAAYLLVIGPFDYWWLRKIKRPMLTWVTFPSYVVFFSVLIYFIGFKLRSGQTEWNELNFVDVVPQTAGRAALRGRLVGSLYSPQNRTYHLVAEAAHAAGRAEFRGFYSGTSEGSRLSLTSLPLKLDSSLFVPVWTSEPYFLDWQDYGPAPLSAVWSGGAPGAAITVTNAGSAALDHWWVLLNGRVYPSDRTIAPGASATLDLAPDGGMSFREWSRGRAEAFRAAMSQQQAIFASDVKTPMTNEPAAAAVSCFAELLSGGRRQGQVESGFSRLPGFDLSPLLHGSGALVLAWQDGGGPLAAVNRFPVRLSKRNVMYRLLVPRPE